MQEQKRNNPYEKQGPDLLKIFSILIFLGVVFSGIIVIRDVNREYEMRVIAGNLQQFKYSTLSFNNIYSGLPGDLDNATFMWKEETENGNGDKIIDHNSNEAVLAWQHIQLAGLALVKDEKMSGGWNPNSALQPNVNIPVGEKENFGFFYKYNEATQRNTVGYGAVTEDKALPENPALTPDQTSVLDLMIDDGLPETGNLKAKSNSSSECFLGGEYKKEDAIIECFIELTI